MDLSWLFRGKLEFLNLVKVIEAFERDSLFQTIFINSLTQENWIRYLMKIVLVTFLPWLSYTISSVIYFAYSLDDRNKYNDGGRSTVWIVVELVIIIQILYLLSIEVIQARMKGPRKYFTEFYNLIDNIQNLGTLCVVITNMLNFKHLLMVDKRIICVFILLSQGFKFI